MEGQAQDTRDLLARELGKLASAEVGRSVAAAAPLTIRQLGLLIDPAAAAAGTARGARFGARFTKLGRHELRFELSAAPERVLRSAHDLLTTTGSMRDLGRGREVPEVAAVVRSGFWSMNPALVRVAVAPDASGSRVTIDAFALEGLIKQHTSKKAATRVEEELRSRLGR